MAKFFGEIGFSSSIETRPGVFEDVPVVKTYYGDVLRNTRKLEDGAGVNNDLTVGNSISIVSDPYANLHFFEILYVVWMGTRWIVTDVEVKSPRLILRLGGVYNGPEARPPDPAEQSP